jgi:diguanylate cyclase (GGDEF)-like protein
VVGCTRFICFNRRFSRDEYHMNDQSPTYLDLIKELALLKQQNRELKQSEEERKQVEEMLRESERRYRELSIVDDLTQLYNPRHFYAQLKNEIDRANRYKQPLTLLLMDLDDFKQFNDTYGHIEGDQVLARLGQVIKRCLRQTDSAYRCGGEEFTVLLPMTTSADGIVTAERIRAEFGKETFSPASDQDVHVTLSIGMTQYKPHEDTKAFVQRADQLMYQAKRNGKDCVCFQPASFVVKREQQTNGNSKIMTYNDLLEEISFLKRINLELEESSMARKRAEEALRISLERVRRVMRTTVQVLGLAAKVRDSYTAGHQRRTADLARAIATEMGLSPEQIEGIRIAGVIHDIGKISLPMEILSKPTKLTAIEYALIKEHARQGYEMLKDVESPWALAEMVHQHHERINGSGYPQGLKGGEIVVEARILAVADVLESMASHRPYRPAFGVEEALEEISKNKGALYDDAVAHCCLRLFREKGFHLKEDHFKRQ